MWVCWLTQTAVKSKTKSLYRGDDPHEDCFAESMNKPPLTLSPSEVESLLSDVETWTPDLQQVLLFLHAQAYAEESASAESGDVSTATTGATPAAGSIPGPTPGPWLALETRGFGDPAAHLSMDDDHGLGFHASLMDGPSVGAVTFSGLEWSDDLADMVAETHWQDILEECPSAEVMETGDQDDAPGMSDVFYWVHVSSARGLARELREWLVEQAVEPSK